MAQSSQALRTRIKSVNSTRKITKAMEMIANAKLFKQRNKMEANREYAQRLQETVDEIVENNPGVSSKFIRKTEGDRALTIIFCSDLGLCGGYNQNVLKLAKESLKKDEPIYVIGTSLYRTFKEEGYNIINEESISSDALTFAILKTCVEEGIKRFQDKSIDKLQVIYTRFVNTMTFRSEIDVLLPCVLEKKEKNETTEKVLKAETMFEPDATTILNDLIPMMIQDVAYADWMEATTAEQGSRRVAMKTATDNADELSAELLLEYNKVRQANITQEITEIVGGSAAV
ncbi:MAG: ATP synthase F1 subunit gamma [Solobacterium sp.]|nr:ATP synthase F1 subunit gamma [Solobacterium sp.]